MVPMSSVDVKGPPAIENSRAIELDAWNCEMTTPFAVRAVSRLRTRKVLVNT
jgi:hypothetical protein